MKKLGTGLLAGGTMQALPTDVLERLTGGLSAPSKMPGYSYSLPAKDCILGSRLQRVPGSICADCYALKNFYEMTTVQEALVRRLAAIRRTSWVEAMAELIRRHGNPWFRWHDSGDLQGVWHLEKIAMVALKTPKVSHWLPTREYGMVRRYRSQGKIHPRNLTIRLSALLVDGPAPTPKPRLPVSTVHTRTHVYEEAFWCPAKLNGNECGPCRACWSEDVRHVSYRYH
jgi:hypothetical protein